MVQAARQVALNQFPVRKLVAELDKKTGDVFVTIEFMEKRNRYKIEQPSPKLRQQALGDTQSLHFKPQFVHKGNQIKVPAFTLMDKGQIARPTGANAIPIVINFPAVAEPKGIDIDRILKKIRTERVNPNL